MSKPRAWKARLARELGRPEKLAVLGVGNVSKGDDAAGVRAAERLAGLVAATPRPRLKVFVAGEAPENFTGAVRAFGPSHVLVVDAAAAGFKPGTVFQIAAAAIPDDGISTHRTPLSRLALNPPVSPRLKVIPFWASAPARSAGLNSAPASVPLTRKRAAPCAVRPSSVSAAASGAAEQSHPHW